MNKGCVTGLMMLCVLAAASAHAGGATQKVTRTELSPDTVNDATLVATVKRGKRGAAVLRAQILLERARFSPGVIDAAYGSNMRQAILGFQRSRSLDANGKVDGSTWKALDADGSQLLTRVMLTPADVAGPFKPLPSGLPARARLDALGYTTSLEALGERFHASPALLRKLNPGASFDDAGTTLVVPNLDGMAPMPAVAKLVVDKSASTVSLLDDSGKILAQYPATTGSAHDPLPIGDWKIKGVARHPKFHYNPTLFWDAQDSDSKAVLPPGPNNPVGVVWIDLSKPHYGIHGTPEPAKIGKTQSHGCIRMTNWSAQTVSEAVRPGMVATLQP